MSTQNQKPKVWRNVSSVTYFTEDAEYKENTMFIDLVEFTAFQKAVDSLKAWHKFEKENVAKEGPYVGKRINELIVATRDTLRELGMEE